MLLAVKLLVAMMAGVVAHRGRPAMEQVLGHGWLELACYAAGVVLGLPFVLAVADELREIGDMRRRTIAAYLLSFLALGAGVGTAWFLDSPHDRSPHA